MSAKAKDTVAARIRELVLESSRDVSMFRTSPLWSAVKRSGSELWLDTGDADEIAPLWSQEFRALTTNNTLLNREVQKGIYDRLIAEAARALPDGLDEQAVILEIAFVLNATHGLMLHGRFKSMVSVELHTDLAHDVARSVEYGLRYREISPNGFYVKVPLTPAGLLAARRLGEEGVPINFTLGFSARQNYLITALARPAFVNVFLGRLNSFVADSGLGDGEMVGEKATLASQRTVTALRERLGIRTRQIAASMRTGAQVAALAGVDVLTMPPKVAREFEASAPDPAAIRSRTSDDPPVSLAPGVHAGTVGLNALWEVSEELRSAVDALLDADPARMDPDALGPFLAQRGVPDLLPRWSAQDVATATADGKIPKYETWKARLAAGEIGLDALMNLSALQSFVSDQQAMDQRIRSNLS